MRSARQQVTEGYKANGYNATYEKTTFIIRTRHEDRHIIVKEITEINTGITFIYEVKKEYKHERKAKKRGAIPVANP